MKITPDHNNRDDSYDEKTVRYYESIDKEGYFYEMYVLVDGKKAAVIVTDEGVSVDFTSGVCVHTNIVPNRLFPGKKMLEWSKLHKILKILESTEMEGKVFSAKQMKDRYKKWKNEKEKEDRDGEPND